ncbi:MAG TPA: ArsA-related P-loop ATPase [Solirubrobacteraceae bacterium]|jgi:anion-transporting  ArsA/GET3 family ATPase|nr:ArsA-related P-loop ATPase [Solirubrobacteraceae bacterium]
MSSFFERELLFVTGKGGVGKTTLAAALGLLAAERGLRTIVVELGDQGRLPALFGLPPAEAGVEMLLGERLWSISIDPDQALLEWLQQLGGRVSGRMLASSGTFQYFAAAAPGAKELVSMVKIWELTQGERWKRRTGGYDLVVIDAPATGHALGLLQSPQTFGAIARVGPIAGQSQRVRELLQDPARSGFLAVALATDMAVTETLELEDGLRRGLGRTLEKVLLNGLLPSRFTTVELERAARLNGSEMGRSAARAARTAHDRARFQHNQLARLRRRRFDVVGVPFLFAAELDLPAVQRIAAHLRRRL